MKKQARFLWLAAQLLALGAGTACSDTGDAGTDGASTNACGDAGLTTCSTACVDTQSDPANCGYCGTTCVIGQICSFGACASDPGTGVGGTVGAGGSTGGWATGGVLTSGGTATGGAGDTGGTASGGTATGGVGTGGVATGGAGTGGTGGSDCGVAPVNPNASTQAKKLLCYLYSINGKNVLSGQQETSWSNPQNDVNWYNTNVGKYPAILGGDYLYPSGTSTRAVAYWGAGGITMIRYHMGAPPNSDTYENSMGTANIGNVLTQGTNEYNSFYSKLDYVAAELQKLEDANVAVLWAPFHEVQPNGWFWWSKGSASQFKQLWTNMFNYLTNTKGLNNLVWLMPFSGSPNGDWYPSKQYLDIAGPDTYSESQPFSSMYNTTKNIVGGSMPIPLHETGVVPQPSQMFPNNAPWVLWNIWAGYQMSHNSLQNIQTAYSSNYTITRDEVPNLK
jgi:hypothetical protein